MTRNDVIELLKVNGDAFISEAQAAGIEPEALFGCWVDSLKNGWVRFSQMSIEMVRRKKGVGEEEAQTRADEIAGLRAAILQVVTAAALMLECMPPPEDGEGIMTSASATGVNTPKEKLN